MITVASQKLFEVAPGGERDPVSSGRSQILRNGCPELIQKMLGEGIKSQRVEPAGLLRRASHLNAFSKVPCGVALEADGEDALRRGAYPGLQ